MAAILSRPQCVKGQAITRCVLWHLPRSASYRFLSERDQSVNTLRPRQDGRHFPDDSVKHIFLNENVWILIKMSQKFVPKGPINNIPAWVQIMAWRRPGDKPLFKPVMASLLTHICVTRPPWVNSQSNFIYFIEPVLCINHMYIIFSEYHSCFNANNCGTYTSTILMPRECRTSSSGVGVAATSSTPSTTIDTATSTKTTDSATATNAREGTGCNLDTARQCFSGINLYDCK